MQEADQQQDRHAPVEDPESVDTAPCRIGEDNGEADAEEQRKDRVEFPVDEEVLQVAHHAVETSRGQGFSRFGREKGIQGELREVCQGD